MKQLYKYILTLLAILSMATTHAWAGQAHVYAKSDPTDGGYVHVATSQSEPSYTTTDSHNEQGGFGSSGDKTFYLYYTEKPGYKFKGWLKTDKNYTCNTNSTTNTTDGWIVKQTATGIGAQNSYYVAIFATIQSSAHNTTVQFDDTKVDEQSSKSITIKHAHAGTVSLNLSGTNAGDFSLSETSFSSTSYQEGRSITINFKPTCAGNRTATLTISSNNGLSSLTINLQGNGLRHTPNAITWVEPIDQNMFVGGTRTINANSTTDGAITFSSSDNSIISVRGNTLTANAVGTVTITATQAATCKYAAVSITKTFTVSDKKTPTFWLNGDPDQLTDNLKTEDTRTITITNVDERMTADYDPNLLSYTFNGSTATIKALDAGTATLKLTQPENNQIFYGERTFTFYITKYDTNTLTNDLATNYMVDDVVAEADIYTINNNEVPVEIISGNNNILKFENGQLKAVGAGTTTLTVKQSATNKWVERTATKTITVHKYDITATINPNNAVWNQLVTPNPFSASTQHKFSGATSAVTGFTVTQQNNEHIAKLNKANYNIQTYYTNGTVDFLITRPEDYKYNALNQPLTLHVNQSGETCNLITDETANANHSTGQNSNGTYSKIFTLNGIGDKLIFKYYLNGRADYNHYVTPQYSTTDTGDNFNDITTRFTTQSTTPTSSDSITLPVGTKRIRFKRTAATLGTKNVLLSNITVTRAKSLTPSDSLVILPVTSIGTPETKTFTLNWSTCADEILLTNSKPHFTLDTYRIHPTNNEGSTAITVTCDATVVDTLRDTIVIYDQTQRIFVPVECIVNDKFIANIKGTTAYSKKVDDTWVADFKFDTCQTTLPSADINEPFYYTIDHDLTGNNVQKPGFENQVISYNPDSNSITAHNAGTAVLTFIQKPTISHYTDTFRCVITVSKHDVELQWKDPVYFNDTISNYFTTTNTISPIVIESQTDTDVAKLTTEFNPTSNNSLDLITFNKEASTTVTISQVETYYWKGYSTPHTITPIDPNNHVTFTIDNADEMFNVFKYNSDGTLYWENGLQLGDEVGGGFNWNDKYIILHFTGIPDTLYFNTNAQGGTTDVQFYVAEGKTPASLTQIWDSETGGEEVALQLNPDTRYIKLCYSGNFSGHFRNIRVTELNQFRAVDQNNDTLDVTHLDFGANQVFTYKTLPFKLRYANPGYKITVESTDPHFTVDPSYIDDIGGENHGTRTINVTYTSSEPYATSSNAMILISDEIGNTDTITLSASSYKAEQTLYWRTDFEAVEKPIIRLKDGGITDAAHATSALPVTYSSDNETIIKVSADKKTLIPVAEGEATITAYQLGNETWLEATPITKTFIVTKKLMQYILWDDNLTNLIKDDTNQTLTLTAKVYIQQEDGSFVFSQEQTNNLVYQSGNSNIVSVSDNILTIHNVGKTTLTVSVAEDNEYASATLTKTVIVRSATPGCQDILLYEQPEGEYIQFFQYNLNEIIKDPIELNRNNGEAGYVSFAHYGESWNLAIQYYYAEIRVEQSLDNGNTWSPLRTIKPVKDQENIDTIPLSRTATHIRFVRNSGGQGSQFLYNIEVHPAQYIEAQDIVDFGEIHVGSRETRTFPLHYSNIKHELSPVPSTTEITASPNPFGECSGFGTQEISVTWVPTQVNDNAIETLTFTDPNSDKEKVVTLKASVIMGTQAIIWDDMPDIIANCADIQFPEYTTAHLPITWEVIEGQEFANFNEQGMLELYSNGTITVQATQAGTANYLPLTPIEYTFTIQLDLKFVGTEDKDWHNPNNWTMCRLPYENESVFIESPADLNATFTIQGITFDSTGSLHIAHTGGLTVGTKGITNAASDGSSITIDNNPQGAGYLRISPEAPTATKHPYFTMNYTTRAFNEGVPRDETWQYMGAPGNQATFKQLTDQTLIYHWNETQGWTPYTVVDTIPTWQGYALTQSIQTNNTYQITAQAIQGTKTIDLTCTASGMKGDNLFVNSFTAPIDIAQFNDDDIIGTWDYKTFYFFNTGSWNDWQGTNPDHSHDASSAGHYYAVPLFSAPYLEGAQTIVPPMQGVYVHTEAPVSITIDYAKHVWNGVAGNLPMRAPQKQSTDFQRVRIQVSSENSGADRMYIIQEASTTRGYDNGYDGKNINAKGQVNIYTNEPFGKMEVSCANNIDSMYIGLRTGDDTHYTLTFGALVGDSLYLQDLENDSIIQMIEGEQYHFTATPNSVNNNRFQLLLHPRLAANGATTTPNINGDNQAKIWSAGKMVYIANAPANSVVTLYTVSGHHVLSTLITNGQSPTTLDLSYLPEGVYILRLNNQVYKFVCK